MDPVFCPIFIWDSMGWYKTQVSSTKKALEHCSVDGVNFVCVTGVDGPLFDIGFCLLEYIEVSKNGGAAKSFILKGCSMK